MLTPEEVVKCVSMLLLSMVGDGVATDFFCEVGGNVIEVVMRVEDADVKGIEVFINVGSMVDKDVTTVACELESELV